MKKRILIIDDEEKIRDVYQRIFNAVGSKIFDIITTDDPAKAVNLIIKDQVDLILLDIRMPELEGTELFDIIREANPNIKVIVSSVYPIEEQKRLLPFAEAYYDKSQGPIKLLEKVTSALLVEEKK